MPEECDDGNLRDGDGCDHNCKIEPGYYCKRGSYNNVLLSDYPCCHISCDDCTIPGANTCQHCREGFIQQGIFCNGIFNYHNPNKEICGDGKKMGEHECDDGNLVDGDGCDSTCHVEPGYVCEGGNITIPDYCRNTLNFSYSIDHLDSYEQLLIIFNKDSKQLRTSTGSLAAITAQTLASIRVIMWSDTETSREVTVIDGVAASANSIRLKLANVGNICGPKEVRMSLEGTNFTDIWDNQLNATDIQASFLKRCFASIF